MVCQPAHYTAALPHLSPLRFVLIVLTLLAGLPLLHSNAGSQNTIFLDFDGHVQAADTNWGVFSATPFNIGDNASVFDAQEAAYVFDIWSRVVEDYSAFDADVTTVQPQLMTSRVAHCLITSRYQTDGSDMAGYESGVGGVAYLNAFRSPIFAQRSPALGLYDCVENCCSVLTL